MSADWLDWSGRPTVYRCYEADALLYVGCSTNLPQRIRTHQAASFWWPSCVRTVVRLFSDVDAALAAERSAIRSEGPRFNIRSRRTSWVADEIQDLITAIENSRSAALPYNRARLSRLQQRLDSLAATA